MKPRLLHYLACPEDGADLVLRCDVSDFSRQGDVSCDGKCGLADGVSRNSQAGACASCLGVDVERGTLTCTECGAGYAVERGIPRLLPPSFLGAPDRAAADKVKEMRSRDNQASAYDNMAMLNLLTLIEKPLFMSLVGRSAALVELGCGTGRFTAALAAAATEIVALDFSFDSLLLCQPKVPDNVLLLQADVTSLPFRAAVFSGATSCQVFEHLPSSQQRSRAVAQAARVVTADGHLVLSAYGYSRLHSLFAKKEGYHPGGIYFLRMTGREFSDLLESHFTVERHYQHIGGYVQMARCRKV